MTHKAEEQTREEQAPKLSKDETTKTTKCQINATQDNNNNKVNPNETLEHDENKV